MGEIIARQRKEIMVLKFKDMFDIIMLSSKHDSGLIQKSKSFVIKDYSKKKMFVDVSDYCTHIITQRMMVNSWVLYRNIFDDIPLNIFKIQVTVRLFNPVCPSTPTREHKLEKVGSYRESRKRFLGFYQKHPQGRGLNNNS